MCIVFSADVLQAAGLLESISSWETSSTATFRQSSLSRSQSSRQNRPLHAAVHLHRRSVLGNGSHDEGEGVFSHTRHTSLLSFDSIGGSFRAAPLTEQATMFESGESAVATDIKSINFNHNFCGEL